MGSTAHALLAWGFEIDRYEDLPEWLEVDEKTEVIEQRYLEATGFLEQHPEPDFDTEREAWAKWGIKKQAALDDCPCVLRDWGEESGPAMLFVKGSQCDADWENATGLDLPHIASLSSKHSFSWASTLMLYCEMMQIPYKEPGWFMTAYYF
jgi:hypothetical protein